MVKCGLSGCKNEAIGRCYYCDLPLCDEHSGKLVSDKGEELYCSACFLYLQESGRLERTLARRVIPNVLWVNSDKCTGCRTCEMICSFVHLGFFSRLGSGITVVRSGEKSIYTPVLCIHCDDPPCLPVCPVEAISKDDETNMVILDDQACIGCKKCMKACPYGAISYVPQTRKVIKCDLCGGIPMCAEYCEPKAIEWTKKYTIGEKRKPVALRYFPKMLKV